MSGSIDLAAIAGALGGRLTPSGAMVRCPCHTDKTPSCALRIGDNERLLVHCFSGCRHDVVRNTLRKLGLLSVQSEEVDWAEHARRKAQRERVARVEAKERERRAQAMWASRSRPKAGDLVTRWFTKTRGLTVPLPPTIACGFYRSASGREWSCALAAVAKWPHREVVACQATPLRDTSDGHVERAWSELKRLTIGNPGGGAVRLSPWREGVEIALTEGVEDGLAVLLAAPSVAVWCCLGAGNIEHLVLPAQAPILLALDGDSAGKAAATLAARTFKARGHNVRIARLPPGEDPASVDRAELTEALRHAATEEGTTVN